MFDKTASEGRKQRRRRREETGGRGRGEEEEVRQAVSRESGLRDGQWSVGGHSLLLCHRHVQRQSLFSYARRKESL